MHPEQPRTWNVLYILEVGLLVTLLLFTTWFIIVAPPAYLNKFPLYVAEVRDYTDRQLF